MSITACMVGIEEEDVMVGKKAILVVEDDIASAMMLTEMFSLADYTVSTAGTLQEAVDAMQEGHYQAALLDLTLPGVTTDQLVERIGQVSGKPPIVVFSARMSEDLRAAADRLGAAGVLQKPARMEAILSTIARVIAAAPA